MRVTPMPSAIRRPGADPHATQLQDPNMHAQDPVLDKQTRLRAWAVALAMLPALGALVVVSPPASARPPQN